ncbi:sigma factor-like helix-turn-helix DNA-binding protein [Lysinibacillus sp. LZ02]|uniref:sigma factor-like helix-turn-helix DNA-binding protein n=1 Tax=Lysinibacillus sp. LZ02 TaxID=3420668 RepID=UPI003D35E4CE
MIRELLKEYKQTAKETRQRLDEVNRTLKPLQLKDKKDLRKHELELLHQLEQDKKILNAALSSLVFSIKWMKTGRMPGAQRGIEKRSSYDEREVVSDPYWIQLKKESNTDIFECKIDEEQEDFKAQLLRDITKKLTKTEREVLELRAKEFSIRETASMLNIPKSTVSDILKRTQNKINEEWMIV